MQTSEERGVAGSDPIDSVDAPLRSPASPLPGSRTASRSIDVKGAGTSREAGARHFPRAATPRRAPLRPPFRLCTPATPRPFEISTRDLRGSVRPDALRNYQSKVFPSREAKSIKNEVVKVALLPRVAARVMVHAQKQGRQVEGAEV